ncbi:hypothetical protein [Streptomyces sp. NPDC002599]|uniref:hypothetical protein n=1 Tax=Streptomyces sp. NPDC002599 TaxID=3154421 RepID=UPI00331C6545
MPDEAFADVLLAELNGHTTLEGRRRLVETVDESVMTAATVAILRDILDHITDYDFERTDNSKFSEACRAARRRLLDEPDGPTAPVIGFVSLISLNVTLLTRRFESPDAEKQRLADLYAESLFPAPAIGRAIELVYGPLGHPATSPGEAAFWSIVDFSSLRYHKAGTTSFILRGMKRVPDNEAGARSPLAVKCVLFPWNKLAAISRATDQYAQRYGDQSVSQQVVKPTASSGQWVLMPFQEGKTLGEILAEFEAGSPIMAARIAMAEDVAGKITTALHELACRTPVVDADPLSLEQAGRHFPGDRPVRSALRRPVRFAASGQTHGLLRAVGADALPGGKDPRRDPRRVRGRVSDHGRKDRHGGGRGGQNHHGPARTRLPDTCRRRRSPAPTSRFVAQQRDH